MIPAGFDKEVFVAIINAKRLLLLYSLHLLSRRSSLVDEYATAADFDLPLMYIIYSITEPMIILRLQ